MNTKPPRTKLRPPKDTDKITIARADLVELRAARVSMERADLFLSFVDDVADEGGKWSRVHRLALVDAGVVALTEAMDTVDRLLRKLALV